MKFSSLSRNAARYGYPSPQLSTRLVKNRDRSTREKDIYLHFRIMFRNGSDDDLTKYFGRIALNNRVVRVTGCCLCSVTWLIEAADQVDCL
jgi:hypothetical protein